jgi:hypothetical protein
MSLTSHAFDLPVCFLPTDDYFIRQEEGLERRQGLSLS